MDKLPSAIANDMTPERWQKIENLFQAARLRATAGERAAFLEGACGADNELRAEVEALLAAEDSAGSFINTSAMKIAAPLIAADRAAQMEGKTIGHYKIISPLGAGGMGEVYLAEDTRVGRKIALKLLPEYLTRDVERARRFQQEARAVIALNHPNIVTVYEIGEAGGTQFIASELVKGETLRTRLSRAPVKLPAALEIAVQVANALAEAHREGIVHRDIKPENIMIRPDGYVKVLDFGIAKLVEQRLPSSSTEAPTLVKVETNPGVVLGTAHYMSPEQARGLRVDARSDIWSLGAVLYEVIAGRVPFAGPTPSDVIAAILETEPLPLVRFAPDVPETLEVIISTALAKDPDERYHAVTEMVGALRRLKQRVDSTAEIERSQPPTSTGAPGLGSGEAAAVITSAVASAQSVPHTTSSAEYIAGEIRRHKTGIVVALGLLVVAGIGIAIAAYKMIGSRQNPLSNHAPRFIALTSGGKVGDLQIDGELSLSPDGKYIAYGAHDAKNLETVCLMQVATRTQSQLVPLSVADYTFTAFSPDGEFVYYGRRETRLVEPSVYRVPILGGTPARVLDNVTSAITFSPDGKRLAFVRDEQLKKVSTYLMVANTDGSGEPRVIAQRKTPDFFGYIGPSWSPDGKILATGAGSLTGTVEMTVVGIPLDGGPEIALTPEHWSNVARVLWLHDGSGLVMTAQKDHSANGTQIWQIAYPGGTSRTITNDPNGYGEVSFGVTSDSSTMATVQARTEAQVWITAPKEDESHAKRITSGSSDGLSGLSCAADNRIVYGATSGEQTDVWIVNADGSQRRQITSDSYKEVNPVMSLDGRYVVFSSDRSGAEKLWRIDVDGSNPIQLTDGTALENHPAFSPDSQWIVFNSNRGGQAGLWKVSVLGGQPVQLSDKFCFVAQVSPDGKLVACVLPDETAKAAPMKLLIIPIEGGEPVRAINLPPTASPFNSRPFWFPDGRAVTFMNRAENLPNVWIQPIDGSTPTPITNFKTLFLYGYALSHDGRQIAAVRGDDFSDIVLIKDFR